MKKSYKENIKPVLKRDFGDSLFQGTIKNNITVLPELKALIPPLQPEEAEQLEKNILQLGCREPLLIWKTTADLIGREDSGEVYVLIDGHNRFGICQKHKLDFNILLQNFDSLEAVKDFMLDNQLGRRNLSPEQMSYLRGLKYLALKKIQGGHNRKADPEAASLPSDGPEANERLSTAERLAEQFGVSARTIRNDAAFAKGLDKLAEPLKQDVLSRKVKIPKSGLAALRELEAQPVPDVQTIEKLAGTKSRKVKLDGASRTEPQNHTPEAGGQVESLIEEIGKRAGSLSSSSPSLLADCRQILVEVQTLIHRLETES